VTFILSIPMELRMAALFVLGACVGSLANLGIYCLAWNRRWISPWSRVPGGSQPSRPTQRGPMLLVQQPQSRARTGPPPRRWFDRVPIFGWLGLRREASTHGRGFWIRPMLVELLLGLGFAGLHWWEVGSAGLLPSGFPPPDPKSILVILNWQFVAHLALVSFMVVAALIDVDEKTIPDAVTVPGALAGLVIAAGQPLSLLPEVWFSEVKGWLLNVVHIASPGQADLWPPPGHWPAWLNGQPFVAALLLSLACLWLWCFAIMPRTWYTRHGYVRAVRLCCARLGRQRMTYFMLAVGVFVSLVAVALWYRGGLRWVALCSSLVGLGFGAAVVWSVRVIGKAVLHREAMGFGDVTLTAMIGAFLGWQATLIVFFLAPFAGLVVGLVRLISRRDDEIPYGPFLCLAALATIVLWAPVWQYVQGVFSLGWLVLAALAVCLVLMAVLLPIVRRGLLLLRGRGSEEDE
jgi:prepilin signal peptidase PulO-like enzyme (type II secretory pathway)